MKLTIGIPTFNRATKLKLLLDFLYTELLELNIANDVEIIISNNASTDNTRCVIEDSMLFLQNKIQVVNQQENLGLVGNLSFLYNHASGEYVWIMGDDDLYQKGIVKKVFDEINTNNYSFIFINHTLIGDNGRVLSSSAFQGVDTSKGNKETLLDVFSKSGTSMMFISATIHRRENIKQSLEYRQFDIISPFYLSFYSASRGRTKYIEDILISDIISGNSWSDKIYEVFCKLVPKALWSLKLIGYPKAKIFKAFAPYIWSKRKMFILFFYHKIRLFICPKHI